MRLCPLKHHTSKSDFSALYASILNIEDLAVMQKLVIGGDLLHALMHGAGCHLEDDLI